MGEDLANTSTADLERATSLVAVSSTSPLARFTNWANTFECKPQRVFAPTTELECRQIVELARREKIDLRPVGVGHSPSDLACTSGWMVRMDHFEGAINVDHDTHTATFKAGTTLHSVHRILSTATPPLALPNIGSISDQTIAGLISTASHGSGINFPVLSQHVKSLKMVLPQPGAPVVRTSTTEDPELFKASLCGLGATGLMLEVEIEVEAAFRLRETKTAMKVDDAFERLDEIRSSAEHARMWWYPDGDGVVVGRADRTYEPANPQSSIWGPILHYHVTQFFLFWARMFPSLTPLVGKWGWWLAKGQSEVVNDGYKVLNFDCLFPQYALEWAIPSSNAKACLTELRSWLEEERSNPNGLKTHFPLEVRWSCADDIYLSPSYGVDTVWIGVVTYRPYGLAVPYRKLNDKFATILASHGGRPHWAKEHHLKPKAIEALYPEFDKFREVCERVDPARIMRSEYLRRHLDGDDIGERVFKRRNASRVISDDPSVAEAQEDKILSRRT